MRLSRRDGGHEAHARLALTRRVTMKLEDEIYLSAYLDGELDPEQRSSVESALLANPALAERLRQLTVVRDLVANLPRLTLHEDLSAAIVARAEARMLESRVSRFRRVPLARIGMAAAALAALTIGLGLLTGHPRPVPPRPVPVRLTPVVTAPTAPPERTPVAAPRPEPQSQPQPQRSATLVASGSPLPAPTPSRQPVESPRDERERQDEREQKRIRNLLESPDLKHVFVVVDEIGGDVPNRVEGLVRDTPRLDPLFGKITVSQGIVIDPKRPNQATVFALVMDQNEVEQFRERLKLDFPTQFEEVPPNPTMVAQLSEIGQIAVSSSPRATALASVPATEELKTTIQARKTPKNSPVVYQPSPEFDGIPVREVAPQPPVSTDDLAAAKSARETESGGARSPSTTAKAPNVSPPVRTEVAGSETPPGHSPPSQTSDQDQPRPTSVVLVWVTTRDSVPKDRR